MFIFTKCGFRNPQWAFQLKNTSIQRYPVTGQIIVFFSDMFYFQLPTLKPFRRRRCFVFRKRFHIAFIIYIHIFDIILLPIQTLYKHIGNNILIYTNTSHTYYNIIYIMYIQTSRQCMKWCFEKPS